MNKRWYPARVVLTAIIIILVFRTNFAQFTNQYKEGTFMRPATDSLTIAVFKTNYGEFEAELFAADVPRTVENFTGLAQKGYYNGIIFHRIIADFMIQGGDPTGTGRGGQSLWGDRFEDEFRPNLRHDVPGVLSMANAGPNTNGSQFFITVVPTPWLDGKHTVFGKVVKGLDVIMTISKVQTTKPFDKPVQDVVIQSLVIEKRPVQ